jgi:hypothetical protein
MRSWEFDRSVDLSEPCVSQVAFGAQYIPSGSTIALPLRIGVFRFEAAVLLAELFKEGPRPTVKLRYLLDGK